MVINGGSLVRLGNSGKKIFSFQKDSQFWYRIGNCISPSARHCVAYKMIPWLPEVLYLSPYSRSYLFYARRREPLVARDTNLTSMLTLPFENLKKNLNFYIL